MNLIRVMCRDNRDGVFAEVFGNKIQLAACFARITNVRDSVAHSYRISEEGYTELAFGADRIQKCIKQQVMERYEE